MKLRVIVGDTGRLCRVEGAKTGEAVDGCAAIDIKSKVMKITKVVLEFNAHSVDLVIKKRKEQKDKIGAISKSPRCKGCGHSSMMHHHGSFIVKEDSEPEYKAMFAGKAVWLCCECGYTELDEDQSPPLTEEDARNEAIENGLDSLAEQ